MNAMQSGRLEKQLDDELTLVTVASMLFGDEYIPTNDEIIRRVRELLDLERQIKARQRAHRKGNSA